MIDVAIQTMQLNIPKDIANNWQQIIDLVAEIFEVPVSLIMRAHPPKIEVFLASKSEGNPYKQGEQTELDGLYCTYVMTHKEKLIIPDALQDPEWNQNPDIKLQMISYLGLPILWPKGEVFGTICVLDNKANIFNDRYVRILEQFRNLIQKTLELVLEQQNLQQAETHIANLEKILPICSFCKKIRNAEDEWRELDHYLFEQGDTKFTHTVCPTCLQHHYKNL